ALIFGLGLGIAGSALGTVISQWGMVAVLLGVIIRRARREGIALTPRPGDVVAVGRDAVPMFVRTLGIRVVVVASTVVATWLGDVQLAAHQLATTVFTAPALALDSLAIAGQALTGRYLGASDPATVHAVTRRLMSWGVGGGAVVSVLLLAASYVVPGWFTPDVAVQESLRAALWVLVITQPVAGYVFVLDGVLMGAGDAPYLAKAGALIAVAVMPAAIAVAWWSPEGPLGLAMLWLACNFLFMVLRALSPGLRVRTDAWMRLGDGAAAARASPGGAPHGALPSSAITCRAVPGRPGPRRSAALDRGAGGDEGPDRGLDVLLGVGVGELHADPGPVLRDHRVGEGGDEHAVLQHRVGDPCGQRRVPEHHRNDRVLARQQLEALLPHPPTEQVSVAEQGLPQLAAALDQLESGERGRHDRRRERVGEEVGAPLLPQHRHDLAAACDVAAAGTAQRLAEGAGVDVHAVGDPEVLGGAGPGRAHETHGVGV